MRFWAKPSQPIDRAVQDLDREIARVQRQIRQLSQSPAAPIRAGQPQAPPPASPARALESFIKTIFALPNPGATVHNHPRRDLFDFTDDPLRELETELDASAAKSRTEPVGHSGGAGRRDLAPHVDPVIPFGRTGGTDARLAQYLSAGSIKTYKPLKHAQRQERKRFFMWLGLALVALWVLYAVIR